MNLDALKRLAGIGPNGKQEGSQGMYTDGVWQDYLPEQMPNPRKMAAERKRSEMSESSEYDHLIGQEAEMMSGGIAYQGTVREVVQSSSGEWRAKVQLFGGNPDKYFWKPVEEFNESINEAPQDGDYTLEVNGREHETSDDLAQLLSMAKNDLAGDDWDIHDNQTGELMYDSEDWLAPGTPEYKDPEPESEPEDDYDDYDDYDNQPAISDEEAMKIARQIEMNFGETFPDGDPIDLAMRMIHQAGFGGRDMWDTNPEVSEKVQDAFEKLTGEDGYYGYHDMLLRQMQDDNPDDEQWQNQTFANEEINDLKKLSGIKENNGQEELQGLLDHMESLAGNTVGRMSPEDTNHYNEMAVRAQELDPTGFYEFADGTPVDEQWQNQTFANEEINDLKTLSGIKESEKEMNEDQSHDDLVNRVNDYDQKFMHDKRYSKVATAWMMEIEDILAGDDEMGSPERYIDDIDDWELGQLLELGDSLEHRITGIEEHREPFAGRPRGGPHLQNDYWDKSDDELEYISKDAGEARDANDEMSKAEYAAGNDHPNSNARRSYGKYADQHHDANTVRRHRRDKQPEGSYSYLKRPLKKRSDEGIMDTIKGAFGKKDKSQSPTPQSNHHLPKLLVRNQNGHLI